MKDASGVRATALGRAAQIASEMGDVERARRLADEAVATARATGDRTAEGEALFSLAFVLADAESETARRHYLAARRLLVDSGESRMVNSIVNNLGVIARHQQRYEEAAALFEESIALARAGSNRGLEATSLESLAFVEILTGEVERAQGLFVESLNGALEAGTRLPIPETLVGFALVAHARRDARDAAVLAAAAARGFATLGRPGLRAEPERRVLEEAMAADRRRLGEEEFERAWQEGWALEIDEAARYALELFADRGSGGSTGPRTGASRVAWFRRG